MDASFKKRVEKAHVNHFLLSLVVVFFLQFNESFIGGGSPINLKAWEVWKSFCKSMCFVFQPHIWLMLKMELPQLPHWYKALPSLVPPVALLFLTMFSMFTWSFCFSLIFLRVKDWLNHFPVLGKRVF